MITGAVQPPDRRRADSRSMSYPCSIYNLGIIANRTIPGIPSSSIDSIDLRISLGELPAWLDKPDHHTSRLSYTSDYTDSSGEPLLRVYRLQDGKYHHFRYADRTEFLVDHTGTEIWCSWQEPLTIEDAATYLLGPVLGFVLLLRGVVCLHASAVVVGSEAIALIGPAGSGKSTTAAAFSSRGFTILADDDHKIAEDYGVWQEKSMYGRKYMGVARTTFLIDANGKIARIFEKVKPAGHADEVLAALQELD